MDDVIGRHHFPYVGHHLVMFALIADCVRPMKDVEGCLQQALPVCGSHLRP
jgi:hypothetical protein